jgi:hypothetical protein
MRLEVAHISRRAVLFGNNPEGAALSVDPDNGPPTTAIFSTHRLEDRVPRDKAQERREPDRWG